jgi:phage tail-like protein
VDVQAESLPRIHSFPAFRFLVHIGQQAVAAFTECTLPSVEWEVEEIKEGGLNTYIHQLPGHRKSGRISLKNGVAKSNLVDWYIKTMQEDFERRSITVTLLDPNKEAVLVWHISEAYPVKWGGPQLSSESNTIAIQTLEFAFGEITVET